MLRLQVIVGSTRPTRAVDLVVPWVVATAKEHGTFDVEVIDLREWPLPIFAEHLGTIGDSTDPTYSEPIVKAWNAKIKEADAYLVITPEYNQSVPGVLENAFDNVFVSFAFRNKSIASISYRGGVGAGIRAIEHLAHIVIEADAVPLRTTVRIPFVTGDFGDGGAATNLRTRINLNVVLDDLAWWSSMLQRARTARELAPGVFRVQAALQSEAAT